MKSYIMNKNPKNPKCPLCGSPMIGYSHDDEDEINWGCSKSPECSGKIINSDKKNEKSVNINAKRRLL